MHEPSQLRSLYSEKWLDIQGFTNFRAAHFVQKNQQLAMLTNSNKTVAVEDRLQTVEK